MDQQPYVHNHDYSGRDQQNRHTFARIIIRRIKIMMELATVQVLEMMMNRHPEGVVEETEGTTTSLSALSS